MICAEYEALPGIGHACGHNVIAATAVGAGVALAAVADELGLTVRVIGTPAEEGGGGKILLLERGAFDGAHLAMMTHPGPADIVEWPIIAAQQFRVRYTGKEAHATSHPQLGVNAADALTVAGVAIGLLRQHLGVSDRVHGIITHGGDAPNIVPAHTEAEYTIRSTTLADLETMRERVLRCFQAGALATGAALDVLPRTKPYAQMHHGPEICRGVPAQRGGIRSPLRVVTRTRWPRPTWATCRWSFPQSPRNRYRVPAGCQPPTRIRRPLHHPSRGSGTA
jgi:amidohydrolase